MRFKAVLFHLRVPTIDRSLLEMTLLVRSSYDNDHMQDSTVVVSTQLVNGFQGLITTAKGMTLSHALYCSPRRFSHVLRESHTLFDLPISFP